MAHASFVPLRVFSSYTMLDGAIDPKAMAKLAKARGFPAMAMVDRNGLYGAPAFASAAKDAGVQPIIGTLLSVARPASMGGQAPTPGMASAPIIDQLALLAQTRRAGTICAIWSALPTSTARWNLKPMCRLTRWTATPMG